MALNAAGTPWVIIATMVLVATLATGQQATQFVPSGLPALFGGVTARLIYRQNGLAENFADPTVRAVYLAGAIMVEPDFWQGQFADTGGVAKLGRTRPSGTNFTITSGNTSSETSRPELNFSGLPNAVLVEPGGYLLFNNVLVSDIAGVNEYKFTPDQPYNNQGIGFFLWPTISLAPDAMVYLYNVSVAYLNPSPLDNCQQYNSKALFGLRQAYGPDNVTAVNATGGNILGPVNITVLVSNASSNATLGNATAIFNNVTFNCLSKRPDRPTAPSAGLSSGQLAAAIAVPIAVVLAALVLACCCVRRRNLRWLRADEAGKDVEAGPLDPSPSRDLGGERNQDQMPQVVQPALMHAGRRSYGSTPSAGAAASSASTLRNFLAIPADTPLMEGIMGTRSIHSTGGSSGSSRRLSAAGGAGSSGASMLTPVGSIPLGVIPSSSRNQSSDSGGRWRQTPSTQSSVMQRTSSDAHIVAASLTSSAAGTESSSLGPLIVGGVQTGGSSGSGQGAAGPSSGSMPSSSSGRQTVAERYAGITSLLKARSDIAVLRELKIGPLLGRGSYGRVYRGRWKATTVAVKIIEHAEGAPGTASSGGKRMSVGRESMLATTISHPNVVQTYHISTMTVAQRSALANTWLSDAPQEEAASGKAEGRSKQAQEGQDDSSSDDNNSHSSVEAQQRDLLETWLLMEYCEKGSLERAINQGRFIRRADRQPEMVGIYKALLDTASGLDHLHSLGVVHGDLKTANVLLKGSVKDPRGFNCKITDFGLSRVLDMDATHISTATYGTIVYMPKELLLDGRMTTATDIYSFGLMMWELLNSTRVFDEGLSIGQMFYMIAYQNWRPHIPEHCPPGYADLMAACWHEDPEQRPTAQQLLKRLQKLYVQAKQELAVSRVAETAMAGAGAAAAAAAGGSQRAGQSSAPGSAGSEGVNPAAASGGAAGAQQRGAPRTAAAVAITQYPAAGSGGSMADSVVGTLSPRASDDPVEGSGGGLGLSGLTISGGTGGKGSAEDGEGYKPYAAAVLQRKRSGSLATGSVTSNNNYTSAHRSSAGRSQLLLQQQSQSASGQAASAAAAAAAAAGASGVQHDNPSSSEMEVFDDAIPSESLLQRMSSDGSGSLGGGGEQPEDDNTYLGFIAEEPPEPPATAAARVPRGRYGIAQPPEVGSLEMTRPNRGTASASASSTAAAAGGPGTPAATSSSCSFGGAPGTSSSGTGSRGTDPFRGTDPSRPDWDDSFRDSFSTSTMPSVIADSWMGSQSSRSFAGSARFTSSMTMGSLPPQHSPTHLVGSGPSGFGDSRPSDSTHVGSGQQLTGFEAASGLTGPVAAASRSYGTLQTVLEGSGPLEGASNSPHGSPPAGTPVPAATGTQGAGGGGVVPRGGPSDVTQARDQDSSGPSAGAAKGDQQAAPAQPAAAPPASPFAALAQRAGSLFGPLKIVM